MFVKLMLPLLVFVALKLVTTFVLPNVVPPTDEVVRADVLINAPLDSVNVPPDVKLTALAVVILLSIAIAGVLDAVKLSKLADPPIAPVKSIVPAPDVSVKVFVPAELLFTAPSVMLPFVDKILLLPLIVVAPKVTSSALVLIVEANVVVLAVLLKPPLKVKLSPPLPKVTPFVFKKDTAFVIVLEAPFITTA